MSPFKRFLFGGTAVHQTLAVRGYKVGPVTRYLTRVVHPGEEVVGVVSGRTPADRPNGSAQPQAGVVTA